MTEIVFSKLCIQPLSLNKCLFHITACTPSAIPMYYLPALWVRSPSGSISFSAQSLPRTKSSAYIWWLRGDATFGPLPLMTRFRPLNSLFSLAVGQRQFSAPGGHFCLRPLSHLHLKACHRCPLLNLSYVPFCYQPEETCLLEDEWQGIERQLSVQKVQVLRTHVKPNVVQHMSAISVFLWQEGSQRQENTIHGRPWASQPGIFTIVNNRKKDSILHGRRGNPTQDCPLISTHVVWSCTDSNTHKHTQPFVIYYINMQSLTLKDLMLPYPRWPVSRKTTCKFYYSTRQ